MRISLILLVWVVMVVGTSACNYPGGAAEKDARLTSGSAVVGYEPGNIVALPGTGSTGALEERLSKESTLACQLSYRASTSAIEAFAKNDPSLTLQRIKKTPHKVYLRDCLRLPRMLQKCLVDQYAYKHIEACQKARRQYDQSRKKADIS